MIKQRSKWWYEICQQYSVVLFLKVGHMSHWIITVCIMVSACLKREEIGKGRTVWRCMKACSACPLETSRRQRIYFWIQFQLSQLMNFFLMTPSYSTLFSQALYPWIEFPWSKRYFRFSQCRQLMSFIFIFFLFSRPSSVLLILLIMNWSLLGGGCSGDPDSDWKNSSSFRVFELFIWLPI